MSRSFPEINVLRDGEVIGALDVRSVEFHTSILADRAVSFVSTFEENTQYQIHINNGGLTSTYFVKEFCARCNVDHYVMKDKTESNIDTLDVKLLRGSTPYPIMTDMFIYNDLKFICT